MGSSPGEAEYGGIDETVGRLVWVRRRNGSWWPGQIMSVDALPKSCLLAAKPGTPVKLLGRDDASVDWYNLNKSKRVKAFRCGEFDNCIEKAKAAVSTSKKSVKYARREDAIICALEIENSYILKDKDYSRVHSSAKKHNGYISTDSPAIRENSEAGNELTASLKKGKLAQELAHCGLSSAEPNEMSVAKTSSVKGKRHKTPNDSEDDGIVGVKRMRGIKDLVLDVASKIKDEAVGESEQVHQETVDSVNFIANESPANSGKSNTPSFKKKRSAVVNGNGHEFKRRRDRRRTLTKVLEESVMVSVPVTCDGLSGTVGSHAMVTSDREAVLESMDSEGITSDFANDGAEGTDDRYENVVLSDCCDGSCDPSLDDKKHKENGSAEFLASRDSGSSDELYDVHLLVDDDNDGFEQVVPSGKREIDCTKQSLPSEQVDDVPVTNGDVPESDSTSSAAAREGISYEIMKSSSKWQSKRKRNARRVTKYKKRESKKIDGVLNDGCSGQGLGLEQHLGSFSLGSDPKTDSRHEEITTEDPEDCFSNWGRRSSRREIIEGAPDEAKGPTRSLPYRHSRFLVPPKYEKADFLSRNIRSEPGAEPTLHDVRIEVNSTNRSHHVPIVSFMSKFNGKAIIGHPLTVEIMESGYSDKLLKQFTDNLSYKHSRKPRSAEKRDLKKHSTSRNGSKKGSSQNVAPSSKKTRRLSALTGSRKSRDNDRNPVVEKPRSSAIACIPLNVVFSRLNEAVNGSKHHIFRTSSNT